MADDAEAPIIIEKEIKAANSYILKVNGEDHTLGNLITSYLLEDKNVIFSGYRIEHPTIDRIILKIHSKELDTEITRLISNASDRIRDDLDSIRKGFLAEMDDKN